MDELGRCVDFYGRTAGRHEDAGGRLGWRRRWLREVSTEHTKITYNSPVVEESREGPCRSCWERAASPEGAEGAASAVSLSVWQIEKKLDIQVEERTIADVRIILHITSEMTY
jgi:hypothetical protein